MLPKETSDRLIEMHIAMKSDLLPEKALFWAILNKAYVDAISPYISHQPSQALRFITGTTKNDRWLFDYYSTKIGADPDFLRERMLKKINEVKERRRQ